MAKTPQISVKDIRGVYAYMPTPVRRDVPMNRHVKNAVDVEEAARAADVLVRDGAAGIVLNGTFGEAGSITSDEAVALTRAVVESVKDRVPVFAGVTTLNIRDTIARARAAREVGAHGLNVGRGMISALNDANIIQWHRDIAEEFPDMAMFLYDDPAAFKRPMSDAVYAELAKIPQIVAGKYRGDLTFGSMIANTYRSAEKLVRGRIKLLTHERDWTVTHRYAGTDAIWSGTMCMSPGAVMALRDAIFAGDYERAAQIEVDLDWAAEGMIPAAGFDVWHINKIPTLKKRIETGGYVHCGPALPPYNLVPEERIQAAVKCGMRDRELMQKYPHKTASSSASASTAKPSAVAA